MKPLKLIFQYGHLNTKEKKRVNSLLEITVEVNSDWYMIEDCKIAVGVPIMASHRSIGKLYKGVYRFWTQNCVNSPTFDPVILSKQSLCNYA